MFRAKQAFTCILFLLFALFTLAYADRIPLPEPIIGPPMPPVRQRDRFEIESVELKATIREQVAEVAFTVVFRNPTDRVIEADYLFPLPEHGAVRDMVLVADGEELPGRILPADEARRIYEGIVRQERDPALVEYIGRGLFRARVFPIPPGESRTVTLRTTYVCEYDEGFVEFSFPLAPHGQRARTIGSLRISVDIHDEELVQGIYSPTHDVRTERIASGHARVRCEEENVSPSGDFRLFYGLYGVGRGVVSGSVVSYRPRADEDGYFMLLASPALIEHAPAKQEQSKTVIFAIDRSGSMRGVKMDQAREAAKFVIENLHDNDLFNIVVYDGNIETFRPELERVTPRTRAEALEYVAGLQAGGMTDIDGALKTSLDMLDAGGGPSYVLFLTDGRPTVGARNEADIALNAGERNTAGARIFCFGVGYDVNARLLDRISSAHGGYTEYVRPQEDVAVSVARFTARLTSPVMTDIAITAAPVTGVSGDADLVRMSYPQRLPDLFEGGQILVVGRYSRSGPGVFTVEGEVNGERQPMSIRTDLAAAGDDPDGRYAFVEYLWAQRRIAAIVQQIDLHGREDALVEELVELSRQYGILTPYTSFLAEEGVAVGAGARKEYLARAASDLDELEETGGRSGVGQRGLNVSLQQGERVVAPGVAYDRTGRARRAENMRQVGGNVFFQRDGQWLQSVLLDAELGEAEIEEVVRYSDRYFELAAGTPDGRSLAQSGTVLIRLDGRIYRVVDPSGG